MIKMEKKRHLMLELVVIVTTSKSKSIPSMMVITKSGTLSMLKMPKKSSKLTMALPLISHSILYPK